MDYKVIEASEHVLASGRIELVETLLYADGHEATRRSLPHERMFKTCSICGKRSEKAEFPREAISCSRRDCLSAL